MTFEALVDKITAQFEVTQAQAVAFVNERLARMVVESEFLVVSKSLGTTVADQSNYSLDTGITDDLTLVDLSLVKITDGSGDTTLYTGVSIEDLWRVDAAQGEIVGDGGVWALDYQADGDLELRLEPAPEEGSLTILGLWAMTPTALTYGGGSTALPVPVDVHTALLDGAKADAYDLEDNQALSAKMEANFAQGIAKLVKRKNSRGDGGQPKRMQAWGYDWR
jgi:hypothetical protein